VLQRTVSYITVGADRASLPEPLPRTFTRFLGLDLAVARRRQGPQRGQQAMSAVGHFRYRAVERLGVGLRRRIEAGQLADELQRGRTDFGVGRRRLEMLRHMISSFAG
jgi:hypothetical protein